MLSLLGLNIFIPQYVHEQYKDMQKILGSERKRIHAYLVLLLKAFLGKGNKSLYEWSMSHDLDGHQAHMVKTSKIFSGTRSPMFLKLSMQHWGPEVHKVYLNDDPGLTFIYFTARSNWVAYTFEWGKLLQSHLMVKTCSKGIK